MILSTCRWSQWFCLLWLCRLMGLRYWPTGSRHLPPWVGLIRQAQRELDIQTYLPDGELSWHLESEGEMEVLTAEPGSAWRHFNAWLSHTLKLERWL
ncbi:MAG: hypothetical protein ACTH5D_11930 [Halomonas sp.]|uniref:hypothetical protein n=1 Tax=Halomonas sp. TaxID=1486246 RepID=UPI003F8F343A